MNEEKHYAKEKYLCQGFLNKFEEKDNYVNLIISVPQKDKEGNFIKGKSKTVYGRVYEDDLKSKLKDMVGKKVEVSGKLKPNFMSRAKEDGTIEGDVYYNLDVRSCKEIEHFGRVQERAFVSGNITKYEKVDDEKANVTIRIANFSKDQDTGEDLALFVKATLWGEKMDAFEQEKLEKGDFIRLEGKVKPYNEQSWDMTSVADFKVLSREQEHEEDQDLGM